MAGLHLITSNRLEILTDVLAENLTAPLSSPFSKETIVVQSRGMERWVAMELAKRLGVAANFDFAFPLTLLFKLFRKSFSDIPAEDPFAQDVLTWKIFHLLQKHHADSALAPVAAYAKEAPPPRVLFPLAQRLAKLFDQYLIFRPEMIVAWDNGDFVTSSSDEAWQGFLWRHLASGQSPHRVALRQRFLDVLAGSAIPHLPERLSLYGISSLPPFHMQVFDRLAQHIDVQLYLLHPCHEYWEDLVSNAQKARLEAWDPSAMLLDVGHPLLASCGRLGQEFWTVLSDLDPNLTPTELFQKPKGSCLLSQLQTDILELNDSGGDQNQIPVSPDDRSIQIHSCHGPRREMETLRDTLFDLFHRIPDLAPQDICVMTPNIGLYSPYIHSVFGCPEPGSPILPYSIADQTLASQGETALFMKLLDTLSGRFTANAVVVLLEQETIRTAFQLTEPDLDTIRSMIDRANIRWGLDADMRHELGLPATDENTWEFGLDRLLFGFAMTHHSNELFAGISPVDISDGSQARLIGCLSEFLRRLKSVAALFKEPSKESGLSNGRDLTAWSGILHSLLDQFFSPDQEREIALTFLRRTFSRLAELGRQAGFQSSVPFAVVRIWLNSTISERSSGSRFLGGGVTFCAMVPMRSIPFRVLCLVGMDHNAFPRNHISPDFDLMAQDPKPGDRSQRNDDRYLFLEAVLSARDVLYVSFVGHNIQDNSPRPPSVLVSELVDCLNKRFRLTSDPSLDDLIEDHIVIHHRLQAFHPQYFHESSRLFSYSTTNAAGARALVSDNSARPKPVRFLKPLPERTDLPGLLPLRDLLQFWDNPARAFFKKRLGADFSLSLLALPEDENLAGLPGLERYSILQTMTERLEQGINAQDIQNIVRAEGHLPPGHVGGHVFQVLLSQAEDLLTRKQQAAGQARDRLSIQVLADRWILSGDIDDVYEQGLISIRFSKTIRPQDLLKAWIKLLASQYPLVGSKPNQALIVSLEEVAVLKVPADTQAEILQLLELFQQGASRPLPFFPKTSHAFAQRTHSSPASQNQARLDAHKAWHPSGDTIRGEVEDPFFRRAFPTPESALGLEFETAAERVFHPLLSCLGESK